VEFIFTIHTARTALTGSLYFVKWGGDIKQFLNN